MWVWYSFSHLILLNQDHECKIWGKKFSSVLPNIASCSVFACSDFQKAIPHLTRKYLSRDLLGSWQRMLGYGSMLWMMQRSPAKKNKCGCENNDTPIVKYHMFTAENQKLYSHSFCFIPGNCVKKSGFAKTMKSVFSQMKPPMAQLDLKTQEIPCWGFVTVIRLRHVVPTE